MDQNVEQEAPQPTPNDASNDALLQLQKDMEEWKDKYIRTMAEMDNLRKRQDKERTDFYKYGGERFLVDLIPVIDNFEKAISGWKLSSDEPNEKESHLPKIKNFVDGISLIYEQMQKSLAKHGISKIDAVGKPFDPNFHQAIQKIEKSDISADIVDQELASGYMLHDRLLRPSVVVVAMPSNP